MSCDQPALAYTGATVTPEGEYLCARCAGAAKAAKQLQKKSLPNRRGLSLRREFPEPAPVNGARWLQLGGRQMALVDAADFERASRKNWFLLGGYAVRREVWGGKVRHDFLQRFVLGLDPDQKANESVVEFIDQNPLNCRRTNLRLAK